jgi:hypothetical protein
MLDERTPHWSRSVDYWLLTTGAEAQTGAAPMIATRYGYGERLLTPPGVTLGPNLRTGTATDIDIDGVQVEFIAAGDVPARSGLPMTQAIRLRHGDDCILIAMEIDAALQRALESRGSPACRVLITDTASQAVLKSKPFAAISPAVAVVTSTRSPENPADATNPAGAQVFRTNDSGTIQLDFGAAGVRVRTER